MDEREMQRIDSLYDDNYAKADEITISAERRMRLATIATVVDILRADARKAEKAKEEEKAKEKGDGVTAVTMTDINCLGMEYPRLPAFLQPLGCTIVEDIEGYRIAWKNDVYSYDKRAVYALRIKGRFAIMPDTFTRLDMEQLKDAYRKKRGFELPEYPSVNLEK